MKDRKLKILLAVLIVLFLGAAAGVYILRGNIIGDSSDAAVPSGVEEIMLSESALTLYADSAERPMLTAEIYPPDAAVPELVWTSENESIVFAGSDGTLYPNGIGTAEVTAASRDGSAHAECTVTVETLEERQTEPELNRKSYDITLYELVMREMQALPVSEDTGKLPAHDEEVEAFANPENFMSGYTMYQFLDLSKSSHTDAETLDIYLKGKGELDGKGALIKKAAEDNGLSEVYLTVLACGATRSGTNELARGMKFEDTIVYDPFGLCRTDGETMSAAGFAYKEGWTSFDMAVAGGARWLSENYINREKNPQNTLYKMRWNLEMPGGNQYSEDIDWADRTARSIGPMLEAFPAAEYRFELPSLEPGRAVAG